MRNKIHFGVNRLQIVFGLLAAIVLIAVAFGMLLAGIFDRDDALTIRKRELELESFEETVKVKTVTSKVLEIVKIGLLIGVGMLLLFGGFGVIRALNTWLMIKARLIGQNNSGQLPVIVNGNEFTNLGQVPYGVFTRTVNGVVYHTTDTPDGAMLEMQALNGVQTVAGLAALSNGNPDLIPGSRIQRLLSGDGAQSMLPAPHEPRVKFSERTAQDVEQELVITDLE